MKNFSKGLLASAVLAASALSTNVAHADVEASVGVANLYLFRGFDFGDGSAQVWGDLNVSGGGFYAGVWASSGDDSLGTEYDLYAGYGYDFGGFAFDINVVNFVFPDADADVGGDATEIGDFSEVGISLTFGDVLTIGYIDNIAGEASGTDNTYTTVSLDIGQINLLFGQHDELANADDDPSHFDFTWNYNDNLSITASTLIDEGDEGQDRNTDTLIVFSYTLPLS